MTWTSLEDPTKNRVNFDQGVKAHREQNETVPEASTGFDPGSLVAWHQAAVGVIMASEMGRWVQEGYQDYSTSYSPSAVVAGQAVGEGYAASVQVGSEVGFLGRTLRILAPSLGAASRIEVHEPASPPSFVQVDQELASSTVLVFVHVSGLAVAAGSGILSLSLVLSLAPSQVRSSLFPLSPFPPVPSSPSRG